MALTAVQGAVTGLAESYDKLSSTQKTMVLVAGGATTVALLSRVMFPHNASKPTSFQLSGGAVANNEVQKEFDAYAKSYSGGEITDR